MVPTYNKSSKIFILNKLAMKPYKLFMFSNNRKVSLFKRFQCCLLWYNMSLTSYNVDTPTLVWTVNLTLSCSLRASEISITNEVSLLKSTVTACNNRHDQCSQIEQYLRFRRRSGWWLITSSSLWKDSNVIHIIKWNNWNTILVIEKILYRRWMDLSRNALLSLWKITWH